MTQQAIAEKIGISRMRVIKLLEKARDKKIVQFKIRADGSHRMELELALIKKYNLQDVFLIPSVSDNINEAVAHAAALYVSDRAENEGFINIGYGDTLSRTLNNLVLSNDSNISLVSLTGGVSYYISSADPGVGNSKIHIIPAPLIASTAEMAAAIIKEPSVHEVLKMSSLASMSIIGIGSVTNRATVVKDGKLSSTDLLMLQKSGAVGDLLGHFIDKDGNEIISDIHDRLISLPIEKLKELNNVIAVAGGLDKSYAIDAALKNGGINVLISDEDTAQSILDL
jgi:DNA-binding transcriptional regulator LsrR (DeoR family)